MDCEVQVHDALRSLYKFVFQEYSKMDSYREHLLQVMAPNEKGYPAIHTFWGSNPDHTFYSYVCNDRAMLKIFEEIGYFVVGNIIISDVQLCDHILDLAEGSNDLNEDFLEYMISDPKIVYATMSNWVDARYYIGREEFRRAMPGYLKRVNRMNLFLRAVFPGEFNRCLYMSITNRDTAYRHELPLLLRAVALGGVEYSCYFDYDHQVNALVFPREFSDAEKRLIHIIKYGAEGVSSASTTKKIYKALENGDMGTAKMLAVIGYK